MPEPKSGQVWSAPQSEKTLNLYNFLFSKMARGFLRGFQKADRFESAPIFLESQKSLDFGGYVRSSEDIQFLIRSLAGKHYGSEWPPIQQAAISLGILRAKEAKRPLEQSAAKEEGFASEAADSALKWIDGDIYSVTPGPNVSTRDSVILSLIRFGIPRMDEAAAFLEKESNRVWRREGNTWVYKTSADVSPDNIPSIEFQVHIAPDLKRAICSVGLTFGRLNGSGYDFVLHKNAGGWKVIGVMPTWVS